MQIVMSAATVCSCKKTTSRIRNFLKRLKSRKCSCDCNTILNNNTMSEENRITTENFSNDEDDEEVKISAEMMATMSVSRPHTQVDYIHHLVPNLTEITSCSFYWGKMDRYEAESLLDSKPEGSFLLRDSAQDEYLFSVSFRRYGRSLHARIEEQGHKFSFDCHDPGVFMSKNIPQLLHHYKDPSSCMFFEPMLCRPINRKKPFSLQTLSRASICDQVKSYSSIDSLELPKSLKIFLKEYHYRHKIRVRHYDL